MKNIFKYSLFYIIICTILTACSIGNPTKLTTPEYIKEVVVQNTKFNSSIDEVLDQVETYNGSEESLTRLNKLIDNSISIINYLRNEIGSKVPDESYDHYKIMMDAYDLYQEGLELYRENMPKPLSEERKSNIKLAESKFEEGKNALKNIK